MKIRDRISYTMIMREAMKKMIESFDEVGLDGKMIIGKSNYTELHQKNLEVHTSYTFTEFDPVSNTQHRKDFLSWFDIPEVGENNNRTTVERQRVHSETSKRQIWYINFPNGTVKVVKAISSSHAESLRYGGNYFEEVDNFSLLKKRFGKVIDGRFAPFTPCSWNFDS